ncbi:hypothetical protein B0O80DRAFT_534391 [Mortierella sp. GBAus27b]|nr:hypothetical protein B0O80DRAFT_534391 [Mortierella sp. GBAus27b]
MRHVKMIRTSLTSSNPVSPQTTHISNAFQIIIHSHGKQLPSIGLDIMDTGSPPLPCLARMASRATRPIGHPCPQYRQDPLEKLQVNRRRKRTPTATALVTQRSLHDQAVMLDRALGYPNQKAHVRPGHESSDEATTRIVLRDFAVSHFGLKFGQMSSFRTSPTAAL